MARNHKGAHNFRKRFHFQFGGVQVGKTGPSGRNPAHGSTPTGDRPSFRIHYGISSRSPCYKKYQVCRCESSLEGELTG